MVKVLSSRIYLPGDYIIVKGQYGKEMFFIRSGDCKVDGCTTSFALAPQLSVVTSSSYFRNFLLLSKQVLNDAGGEICTMKRGQSFGEVGHNAIGSQQTLYTQINAVVFSFSPVCARIIP
jgi:hypothetical protein